MLSKWKIALEFVGRSRNYDLQLLGRLLLTSLSDLNAVVLSLRSQPPPLVVAFLARSLNTAIIGQEDRRECVYGEAGSMSIIQIKEQVLLNITLQIGRLSSSWHYIYPIKLLANKMNLFFLLARFLPGGQDEWYSTWNRSLQGTSC